MDLIRPAGGDSHPGRGSQHVLSVSESESSGLKKLFGEIEAGDEAAVLQSLETVSVNTADEGGTTPLLLASGLGKMEIVEMLIEKKADVMLADLEGDNPLMMAISQGHMRIEARLKPSLMSDDQGVSANPLPTKHRQPESLQATTIESAFKPVSYKLKQCHTSSESANTTQLCLVLQLSLKRILHALSF